MRILLLFMIVSFTQSASAQNDFTGQWKLNVDKSQFNNTPGTPAAAKISVEQKDGSITFRRDERPKETLTINDAKGIELGGGENKTNVTMKWAADKRRLIETRTYTRPKDETAEVEAKKTRTWSLSDDKKTLTIRDDIETTAGKVYNMVLMYDRQ